MLTEITFCSTVIFRREKSPNWASKTLLGIIHFTLLTVTVVLLVLKIVTSNNMVNSYISKQNWIINTTPVSLNYSTLFVIQKARETKQKDKVCDAAAVCCPITELRTAVILVTIVTARWEHNRLFTTRTRIGIRVGELNWTNHRKSPFTSPSQSQFFQWFSNISEKVTVRWFDSIH